METNVIINNTNIVSYVLENYKYYEVALERIIGNRAFKPNTRIFVKLGYSFESIFLYNGVSYSGSIYSFVSDSSGSINETPNELVYFPTKNVKKIILSFYTIDRTLYPAGLFEVNLKFREICPSTSLNNVIGYFILTKSQVDVFPSFNKFYSGIHKAKFVKSSIPNNDVNVTIKCEDKYDNLTGTYTSIVNTYLIPTQSEKFTTLSHWKGSQTITNIEVDIPKDFEVHLIIQSDRHTWLKLDLTKLESNFTPPLKLVSNFKYGITLLGLKRKQHTLYKNVTLYVENFGSFKCNFTRYGLEFNNHHDFVGCFSSSKLETIRLWFEDEDGNPLDIKDDTFLAMFYINIVG